MRASVICSLRRQRRPLLNPESVLLVHDHESEISELHCLGEQGVRADHDPGIAGDDLQQILAPLNLSQQYVLEQIGDKLDDATQAAMTKKKVTVVLDSQSIIKADQVYNLNQDILAELNVLIPSAQLVPPAGWMPRAQREQAAQQAAQQGQQQPAPAAPAKQPQGR